MSIKYELLKKLVVAAVWVAHMIVFFLVIKTCPQNRAAAILTDEEEKAL